MAAHKTPLFDLGIHCTPRTIIEQIEERALEPTATQVERAIEIIGRHLSKEAKNRQVPMLAPADLCPAQKRDLVRDLARLLQR